MIKSLRFVVSKKLSLEKSIKHLLSSEVIKISLKICVVSK